MRRLATTLLTALAALGVSQANAQALTVGTIWSRTAAGANAPAWFSTTGSTERGLALGNVFTSSDPDTRVLNERLFVVSRNAGTFVRILDAATGGDIGTLNTAGITGGTFALNDIEVSTNGAVYACNLSSGTTVTPAAFKCYRWTNEADAPSVAVNILLPKRYGDKVTLTGSTADNSAIIWAASNASNTVLKLTTVDNGVTFALTAGNEITLSPNESPGNTPSVAPMPSGGFYLKGTGVSARQYDAVGAKLGTVPGTVIPTGASAIRYLATGTSFGPKEFLVAHLFGAGNERAVIADVTGTSGAAGAQFLAYTPVQGTNANTNGTGDVDIALSSNSNSLKIFVLSTNNGVGAYSTAEPLPVELVAFTAAADGTSALLRWATASETNNAGFTIEARANGAQTWSTLGQVAGAGTTLEASAYSFRTAALAAGRYTFRLRQTDFDGASSYSAEVEAEIGMASAAALGVRGARTVTFSVREAQAVTVGLYDALGRRVALLFDGAVEAGAAHTARVGDGLSAGVYFVRLEGARAQATRSLVVR